MDPENQPLEIRKFRTWKTNGKPSPQWSLCSSTNPQMDIHHESSRPSPSIQTSNPTFQEHGIAMATWDALMMDTNIYIYIYYISLNHTGIYICIARERKFIVIVYACIKHMPEQCMHAHICWMYANKCYLYIYIYMSACSCLLNMNA